MIVHDALNALVRTLLAPTCVSCSRMPERPLDGPICSACWTSIPMLSAPLCECCGEVLPPTPESGLCGRCQAGTPRFAVARSAGRYDGPLRRIIHAYKYEGRRFLAAPLAALMTEAGSSVLSGADAVVPVPLHPWRALTRGFNQADDLACHVGLPVWRALRRTRLGPAQATLPARQRHANVERAFAVRQTPLAPLATREWSARLRGACVVLIDDVMTTGATLDACSAALVEAGVASVRALTVARRVARPARRPLPLRGPAAAPRR